MLAAAGVFSTLSAAQSPVELQKIVAPGHAELLARAGAPGGTQVLVTLDLDPRAEALLNADEIGAQRNAIRNAQTNLNEKLRDVNAQVLTAYTLFPIVHMNVDQAALQRLLTLPDVRYVQENGISRPMDNGSNGVINVAAAWAAGFDGTGWTVVVMDSGVQSTHPFLAGKLVDEVCFSSTVASANAVTVCPNGHSTVTGVPGQTGPGSGVNCPGTTAGCDHGTSLAGIAVGKNYSGGPGYDGVARGANYISVQIISQFADSPTANPPNFCTASGLPSPCSASFTSDQLAALQYILATFVPNPAYKIASISLGVGAATQATACDTNTLKTPIDGLRAAGVATVISAGNFGSVGLSAPSCISTSISVGSTDNSDVVQGFSNRSSLMTFFAPGFNIAAPSSVPPNGFTTVSGTSPSAAHVAAAWAVLKQRNPTATVTQILTALQSTGAPISTNGFTKPRINIGAAATALGPIALQSAASRKTHGAAGTFDLPLSLVSVHNPTTEPRQGPAATIVFTFNKAITSATVLTAEGTADAGPPTFSGNDVIVGLTNVANQQYVTINLNNVASADGGTGGSGSVRIGFLTGDVNQNRVVSLADLGLVNAQLAQAVTAANYLKDVNASGTLTLADKGITNANLTKALPAP